MLAYPRHPSTVEFGELECCALRAANAREAHHGFVSSFMAKAKESEPRYNVSIISEIFTNTTRLVFIPRSVHRAFYLALAFKERDILARSVTGFFNCGHAAGEHTKALESICSKMAYPQGSN